MPIYAVPAHSPRIMSGPVSQPVGPVAGEAPTDLVVANAAIAVTADNVTLTQVHTLVVANAAIAVTADNVDLTTPSHIKSYTDFTGTNGAAWPAPWTTVGGTIQTNRGRLLQSGAWAGASAHTTGISLADVRFEGIIEFVAPLTDDFPAIVARHNGVWSGAVANAGIIIYPGVSDGTIAIQTFVGGANVENVATGSFTWAAATRYRFTLELIEEAGGTRCRAKVWAIDSFAIEPSDWTLEGLAVHASRPASGGVGLSFAAASGTSAVFYDDLMVQDLDSGRLKVIPVGDSITAGPYNFPGNVSATWRRYVYDHFASTATPLDMVGRFWANGTTSGAGVSGTYAGAGTWDHDHHSRNSWWTSDVDADIAYDIDAYQPDIAILYIGLNDLLNGQTAAATATEVGNIVTAIRAEKADTKFVVCQIAPAPAAPGTTVVDFNAALVTTVAPMSTGTSPIVLADCYTGFSTGDIYDTIHFDDDGDQFVADKIIAAMEVLLADSTDLVVADASIAVTAENVTLTQVHSLTVAAASIAVTADNVTLTQAHSIVVADAAIAVTADNVTITQVHALVVADAAIAVTADSVTLAQTHVLTVANAAIAVTADNVALTQVHSIVVADAAIAVTADNVALTQVHALSVNSAFIAVTTDSPTLTQTHSLTVADAAIAVTADNVTLTQVHVLTVASASIAVTADNVALTQVHVLTVAAASIAVAADNVTLTQIHSLVVANAAIAVTADNVDLTTATILTVADAFIAVTAENVGLTQVHALVVASASIAVTADSVTLTQVHVLAVADAFIAITASNVVLTGAGSLVVANAFIAVTADNVVLSQVHTLVVANAAIAVTADNVLLAMPASGLNMQVTVGSPVFVAQSASVVMILRAAVAVMVARAAGGARMVARSAGDPRFVTRTAGAPDSLYRQAGTPATQTRSATITLGHGNPGQPQT